MKFIVVDTHQWFGGKRVIMPVSVINKMQWSDSKVYLDINMAAVEKCKLFDEADFMHLELAKS